MGGSLRACCCLVALMITLPVVWAAPPQQSSQVGGFEIITQLSAGNVLVAEPFEVRITVVGPAGSSCAFPPLDNSFGVFQVIDQEDAFDLPTGSGGRSWTRTITLEHFLSGEFTLPSLEIVASQGDSPSQVVPLFSHPLIVRVQSVLDEQDQPDSFRDLQPVVDLPAEDDNASAWSAGRILVWAGGAVVISFLAAAGSLWLLRRYHAQTPYQWAKQRLVQLRTEHVAEGGDSQATLLQTAAMLRQFLALQFADISVTMTSQEMLAALRKQPQLDTAGCDAWEKFLAEIDAVKFAGQPVSPARQGDLFAQAEKLLEQAERADQQRTPARERS
ncbi:hypothetical protein SH139x_005623 [Planctomycetaceae bacterium SH139]